MSGPVNPNAIIPYNGGPINLGLGVDQSSPIGRAQPGSLRNCCNFEIVDGNLQLIEGSFPMGFGPLNGLHEMYLLVGTPNVDWTQTLNVSDGEEVEWYADNVSFTNLLGTGLWFDGTVGSKPWRAIVHLSGQPPTGTFYFVGQTSNCEITITSDDHKFAIPSDTYHNAYEDIIADAVSAQIQDRLGLVNTWGGHRPAPLQDKSVESGISHIVQCNDNLYAVSDFPAIYYINGGNEPSIGDKIHFNYPTANEPIAYIAGYAQQGGDWENGDSAGVLYLYPQADSTLNPSILQKFGYGNLTTIQNLTKGNTIGQSPPQTSPAAITQYIYHGLLWKLDTDSPVNTGWSFVHPGWSVRFGNDDTSVDQTAPSTEISPLVVTDAVSRLGNTGQMAFNTPVSAGTPGSTWNNLANLAADDASYADTTITANSVSEKLRFTVPTSTAIPDTAKITGIKIEFEAYAATSGDIYCSVAQLRNDGTFDNNNTSENRGHSLEDPLTASPQVFTLGGDLDLWGMSEIPLADWNNQDIQFNLRFENTNAGSRQMYVDYVFITVYYTVNSQNMYFVRAGSDITTGTAFAYQVHDGDWSTDDASGWLTFDSIADPGLVKPGDAIWTGTGGTGDFIGNVRTLSFNSLPSTVELEDAGTRSQTVVSSLGATDGEQAAYCVNGIGPCWAIDADDRVRFIRTAVSPDKDKPRYVAEHRNHLLLGLKEHVLVSSIAAPDNMNTADGATSWHVRDRITGMHHTTDGTTVILCRDSIHQFQGAAASGSDPFALSTITNKGGAKDYSSVEMGDIYFLTSGGMTSVSATDKFGNFDAASISHGVEDWLRQRITMPSEEDGEIPERGFLEAIPVKTKNQIRYFFKDGWVMTATLAQEGPPQFTFQHYSLIWNYAIGAEGGTDNDAAELEYWRWSPTALHSAFTTWGEERVFYAKRNPYAEVVRLDASSNAFQGNNYLAIRGDIAGYVELNPIVLSGELGVPAHLERCTLVFESLASPDMVMVLGTDFTPPKLPVSNDVYVNNPDLYLVNKDNENYAPWPEYTGRRLVYVATSHMAGTSLAHSWTIFTLSEPANYDKPQRLVSIIPQAQIRQPRARMQNTTLKGASVPRRN